MTNHELSPYQADSKKTQKIKIHRLGQTGGFKGVKFSAQTTLSLCYGPIFVQRGLNWPNSSWLSYWEYVPLVQMVAMPMTMKGDWILVSNQAKPPCSPSYPYFPINRYLFCRFKHKSRLDRQFVHVVRDGEVPEYAVFSHTSR